MNRLATLCLVVFLLSACAGGTSSRSAASYTQEMNGQIGKAEKIYFVEKYGPPEKQAVVDQRTEVWEYRLDEQKYTSQTGYRFATFDRLRITFTEGKLSGWSLKAVTE